MSRQTKKDSPFGQILSVFMKSRNLSNKDLSVIAGVSAASIVDWRKGGNPTDFQAVARIADNFGISLRYLLTGIEENQPKQTFESWPQTVSLGTEVFSGICEVKIRRIVPYVAPSQDGPKEGNSGWD